VKKATVQQGSKPVAKKPVAKKSVAKQPVAKKPVAKKAVVKKPVAKKAAVKKAAKPVAKKSVAKKAVVKKPVAKKAVVKKAAKPVVKKPVVKKAVVKKSVAKQPVAKTEVATKAATKPAAPTKAAGAKKKTVICELSGFEVTPGKANLSPKTLERLRKKLLEEKARLQDQADELAAEAEQLARDREGGDTQFDEESGDGDTVNVERERDLLLSASARQVVDEIDEALARMKKGTYGVCIPAGRRLPLERLEAIPQASVCVDCKARAERRR